MGETTTPLKPVKVDHLCDACGKGHYRPTGGALMSSPAQYPHTCNQCGDQKTFKKRYPFIDFIDDSGNLVMLSAS